MKRMICFVLLLGMVMCAFAAPKTDKKQKEVEEVSVEKIVLKQQKQLLDVLKEGLKAPTKDAEKEIIKILKNIKQQDQFLLKNDSLILAGYKLTKTSSLFEVYSALTKTSKDQVYTPREFSYENLSMSERQYEVKVNSKKEEKVDSLAYTMPIDVHVHSKVDKECIDYDVCFAWSITLDKNKKLKKQGLNSITTKGIQSAKKTNVSFTPEIAPQEADTTAVAPETEPQATSEEALKQEVAVEPDSEVSYTIQTEVTYKLIHDYIEAMSAYMVEPDEATAEKLKDMFADPGSLVEVSNWAQTNVYKRSVNQYFTLLKPAKMNMDIKGQDFNEDFTEIVYTIGQAYDNTHYCDFTEKQVHIRYSSSKKKFVIEKITVAPGSTQKCE